VPRPSRSLLVALALTGGAVAFVVAFTGSLIASVSSGLLVLATALVAIGRRTAEANPMDPSRRRFLRLTLGAFGFAAVAGGSAAGFRLVRRPARTRIHPILERTTLMLGDRTHESSKWFAQKRRVDAREPETCFGTLALWSGY